VKTEVFVPPGVAVAWAPNPGPQTEALQCEADELLYGGAAAGGKTDFLLVAAIEGVSQKGYKAVIFRRTYPELEHSIIERARELIPAIAGLEHAVENISKHEWAFGGGTKILFRHLEDDAAALAHRSAEYQYIAFDELTTFTERQYRYLASRLRTSKGHTLRLRAATNPGGPGHEWVKRRWAPWLDDQSPVKAVSGETLWCLTNQTTGADVWVPEGTPGAKSRCYIGAKLEDNPHVNADYEATLNTLDPLTRKQLAKGDWDAKPAPKGFFDRKWAPIVDSVPLDCRPVRGWDRAATEQQGSNDPDWTAGVKMSHSESTGLFYVEHVRRLRAGPGGVVEAVKATTKDDGIEVMQVLPCDPASAGKLEASAWLEHLMGYQVDVGYERGDKLTRAKVWSAQACPAPGALYGKFRIVRGDWNEDYLSELEAFPTKGAHDDQVDATSTAFRVLVNGASSGVTLDDYRRYTKDPHDRDAMPSHDKGPRGSIPWKAKR
jgi:predicted phage terminase large subunit-like protein